MKSSALVLLALLASAACGPGARSSMDLNGVDAGSDSAVCTPQECSAGESCCGAACSSDPSCALTLTGLSSLTGYIGGGAYVKLHGTGFARGMRAYIGSGRAPIQVMSATEAMILTPPAQSGTYDVHVDLGSYTATLPAAYEYQAYGFTDSWVTVAMQTPRGNFPAMIALQDGRVLIAGGSDGTDQGALASAELYDPQTRATSPTAGPMHVPRYTVSGITLLDGRVLVLGVCNTFGPTYCAQDANRGLAEVFDPATNTFSTLASSMVDHTRVYPSLVLLPDGRVLIQSQANQTAELFDPQTNSFALMPVSSHFSALGRPTRLRDGRVAFLSVEGVELFDEDTGTLAMVPVPGIGNNADAVFTLPDGRVLSPGGTHDDGSNFVPTDRISVFDPSTSSMQLLPQLLTSPRMKFGSALLRDGSVMVAAGVAAAYPKTWWCTGFTFPTTKAVDRIDPLAGTVTAFPPLPDNNMELVATTMGDGSILVGGGAPCGGAGAYAYLYFLESAPIL